MECFHDPRARHEGYGNFGGFVVQWGGGRASAGYLGPNETGRVELANEQDDTVVLGDQVHRSGVGGKGIINPVPKWRRPTERNRSDGGLTRRCRSLLLNSEESEAAVVVSATEGGRGRSIGGGVGREAGTAEDIEWRRVQFAPRAPLRAGPPAAVEALWRRAQTRPCVARERLQQLCAS